MACSASNFFGTAETTIRTQLSFIAARSIHPRCNRAATVLQYVTRDPQDFYAAYQLIAPRACWWRQYTRWLTTHHVYDAGHTWSCTRIIRITFTRVCSPERTTRSRSFLPYWITLALTILFLPIWGIPSPIELVLAPDRECLVNDIIS